MRGRNLKRSSAQQAHVVNRMFTTLETKGILRTAPEEFMLTSLYKANDALAAAFFLTCRHEFFIGTQYLDLYGSMLQKETLRETTVRLSTKRGQKLKQMRNLCTASAHNIPILGICLPGSCANGSRQSR